jgi:AcrR family transcriptional regulator
VAKARAGRPAAKDAGEVDARILRAATEVFLERGYDGATFEAVAAAAGSSKATLYSRHSGKPALFAAVIRANVDEALVPAADVPADLPLRERLTRAGRAVITEAMAPVPLALMRLFIAEAPRQRDLIREADALGRRAGIRRIAEAIAGPAKVDPAAVARAEPAAARFIDLAFVPTRCVPFSATKRPIWRSGWRTASPSRSTRSKRQVSSRQSMTAVQADLGFIGVRKGLAASLRSKAASWKPVWSEVRFRGSGRTCGAAQVHCIGCGGSHPFDRRAFFQPRPGSFRPPSCHERAALTVNRAAQRSLRPMI